MSLQMVSEICGDENDPKWDEAVVAAEKALEVITICQATLDISKMLEFYIIRLGITL